MQDILVAIPVYNEAQHVHDVVTEVRRFARRILVVDDGSKDGTTEILQAIPFVEKIFHPTNMGYGQALLSSFEYAIATGFEWLITIDCDLQHEPRLIPQFVDAAKNQRADIISGSRYLANDEQNHQPPAERKRINAQITQILNQGLGLEITDAFCGFKAYRTVALKKLSIDVQGYAMPLQLWVQASALGLKIAEIPMCLIYEDTTRHFGGDLDDPQVRLDYYLSVISDELTSARLHEQAGQIASLAAMECP